MARLARVIALDTPHHITQRGNARQAVFGSDADRGVYLQLLAQYCELYRLSLAGYCLMSNHVHLIAIPRLPESLPNALKGAHGRYATYLNARRASSGHVWQGRYYSCPLEGTHFWAALRYVERNPVRAGMAAVAEDYTWSSAAVHCGIARDGTLLDLDAWRQTWTPCGWRDYIAVEEDSIATEIRRSTHTGRPMGTREFVGALEVTLKRRLTPERGGRPRKETRDARQDVIQFGNA
jgi:REP-associated tyrosine transposase